MDRRDEVGGDGDEAEAGARALTDFGVAFGAMVVLVVLAVVAVVFVGTRVWLDRVPAAAGDLERFDEIELYELAGEDAVVGVTRSNLLPIVVHRGERGASSLAVVDADAGNVIDGGTIPVEGWIGSGYPRASDRYVAMVVAVCSAKPHEGDSGDLECGGGLGPPVGLQLSVFDTETQTWDTLPLDGASEQELILEDVDGSTAVVKRHPNTSDDDPAWATVDLSKPLALGPFEATKPSIRPNGLATSGGHIDGFGWKARDTNGEAASATWIGTVDGTEKTVEISMAPLRHLYGAGRCLVIGSFRSDRLTHVHRLCADP